MEQSSETRTFGQLVTEFTTFSLSTFEKATALSSLDKLKDEMDEVANELIHGHRNLAEEYADCIMCLFDSAARAGVGYVSIHKAFADKLVVNKSRTWKRNPDNTYSHVN